MGWQRPKTDWNATDHVSPDDMNRISGNLNVLYPAGNLKENYTRNDYVTVSQWEAILSTLRMLNMATRVFGEVPGTEMTAPTFNAVEGLTLEIKERMELLLVQDVAAIYTGDNLYPDENYVRGL